MYIACKFVDAFSCFHAWKSFAICKKKKNYTVAQPTQIPSTCYSDHPSEHADERQGWRLCTNSTVDQPTQIPSTCYSDHPSGHTEKRQGWRLCTNATVDQPTQIASICSCKNTKGQVFTRSTRFLRLICSFIKQYINSFSFLFFLHLLPQNNTTLKKKRFPPRTIQDWTASPWRLLLCPCWTLFSPEYSQANIYFLFPFSSTPSPFPWETEQPSDQGSGLSKNHLWSDVRVCACRLDMLSDGSLAVVLTVLET